MGASVRCCGVYCRVGVTAAVLLVRTVVHSCGWVDRFVSVVCCWGTINRYCCTAVVQGCGWVDRFVPELCCWGVCVHGFVGYSHFRFFSPAIRPRAGIVQRTTT